jgi:hypothetical protein
MTTTRNGYRYAGESVQIEQSITEAQLRAIEQILGERPSRFKEPVQKLYFEPTDPRRAVALLEYLRDQNISHSIERLETWTPPAASEQARPREATCVGLAPFEQPPSVAELVALAAHLQLSSEDLDDAVHDAAGEHAAALNSEGLDGQIEYLVARLGPTDAQAAIEAASRGDRTPPLPDGDGR